MKKTGEARLSYSYTFLNSASWVDFLLKVEIYLNPGASNFPKYTPFHMFVTVVLKLSLPKRVHWSINETCCMYILHSVYFFSEGVFSISVPVVILFYIQFSWEHWFITFTYMIYNPSKLS